MQQILKNIIPHKGINNKIPDLEWYGPHHNIRYDKLRAFGCFATCDRQENASKLYTFKKFIINLGRAENANAYKILDIQNGTIYLRRNVEFYETKFIKTKDIDIFNINKEIISDNIEDLNNVEFYQDLILEDLIDEFENNENVEKNNEINITEENIDNNNYNENTNSNKNEDIVNKQNNDEDDIISSSEYEPLNIRLNKIKENNNEEIKNNNYISGTESDIESNYNTSSDELVPLNIRKMKRKIVSSSNDEDNQNHKRIEKDSNIIGEANHAEIWNNCQK